MANKLKYLTYLIVFLASSSAILLTLNIISLKKIEIINNKINDGFNYKNIQNAPLVDKNFKSLAVVGKDDRVSRDKVSEVNKQILHIIGGVGTGVFRNGKWFAVSTGCTGTLYNKKYVITAAHCIQNTEDESKLGELRSNIIFLPEMINRRSDNIIVVSKIIRSTNFPKFGQNSKFLNHDWVILIAEKDAPEKYSSPIELSDNDETYPFSGINTTEEGSFLSLFGYSGDRSDISIHEHESINFKDRMGALRVNFDLNPGSSGSSLIETIINKKDGSVRYKIHGVVSGHSCEKNEFLGINCYTNNPNSPNIITPIIELKEALEQYLLDNNLPIGSEKKNIDLDGPIPTSTPKTIKPTSKPSTSKPTTLIPKTIKPTSKPTISPIPTTLIPKTIKPTLKPTNLPTQVPIPTIKPKLPCPTPMPRDYCK